MIGHAVIWGIPEALEWELDTLRINHPRWSDEVFLSWAKQTYEDTDYARRKHDAGLVQDLMTDEFFPLFKKKAEDRRTDFIDRPLDVQGLQIVNIGSDGENDIIDVKFVGERLSVKGKAREVVEYASFTRPHYERFTDRSAADWNGTCPKCFAALPTEHVWRCPYCGQNVAEQSTGWKIRKIIAEKEYAG